MTYASAKQNTENLFSMSDRYLKRTRKHLNESLDIKEVILPERRGANIRETKAVLRGLPTVSLLQEIIRSYVETVHTMEKLDGQDEFEFIEAKVFEVMQNVLQDDFIDVWEQLDLYNCMTGSSELNKIIRNSFGSNHTETWQSAISLRLEEKMIASNGTLHDLHRVHDAYNNAVPLVNNNVTPEGRYDFLYITSELFPQTTEINETYIQLRGHLHKYIRNIDALISIYNTNGHKKHTCTQCVNYSRGFREASVEYERDLRKYESLVVRKPLKRILAGRKQIVGVKNDLHTLLIILFVQNQRLVHTVATAVDQYIEFNKTHKHKISEYLDNVKTKRFGSTLDLAGELMSDRFLLQLENFINIVSGIEDIVNNSVWNTKLYQTFKCVAVRDASHIELLHSFFAQMYDHYNKTTGTEKANMNEYFMYLDKNQLLVKFVRDEVDSEECYVLYYVRKPTGFRFTNLTRLIKDLSSGNLRSFKIRLKSFLETTRLDGKFFRYVLLY